MKYSVMTTKKQRFFKYILRNVKGKFLLVIPSHAFRYAVEPRYNKPLYNEVLGKAIYLLFA